MSSRTLMYNTTKHMKSLEAFKTISEASKELGVASSAVRFWEREFKQIKPFTIKNRRYYSPDTMIILKAIKDLLYEKGYTIAGAAKHLEKHLSAEKNVGGRSTYLLNKINAARQELNIAIEALESVITK